MLAPLPERFFSARASASAEAGFVVAMVEASHGLSLKPRFSMPVCTASCSISRQMRCSSSMNDGCSLTASERSAGRSTSMTALMPAGPCGEDDHPIREEHGLVDLGVTTAVVLARAGSSTAPPASAPGVCASAPRTLVEQQELRLYHQGARDIDALAHPAGELVRIVLGEAARRPASPIERTPRRSALPSLPCRSRPYIRSLDHRAPGNRLSCWNTMAPIGTRSATVRPSTRMSPAVT